MKVVDPTLFLYAGFHRHLPGHVPVDPRQLCLRLFRGFERAWGLEDADSEGWKVQRIEDLSLDAVDQAEVGLVEWIRRTKTGEVGPVPPEVRRASPPEPPRRQAALYTYGDSLYLYLMDSLGTTTTDFDEAWGLLSASPRELLGNEHWEESRRGFFGLNVVCSVLFEDEGGPGPPSEAEVRTALASISPDHPAPVDTRIGQLWAVGSEWLGLPIEGGMVATWVLVSPTSSEDEVYGALQLGEPEPPLASRLFTGRQKFWWQLSRYEDGKQKLRRARASLDKRVEWMIAAQRDFEEPSKVTDSQEMEELRVKSARAHTDLAALGAEVLRVRDAKTTLEINLGNYRSFADALRAPGGEDRFFTGEIARMEANIEQVEKDTDYHEGGIGRASGALASADAGFAFSQDRQTGRQVRLGVVQVSGLFASLMALIATEVLRLGSVASERPWFAAKVILLVLAGTFTLAQILQAWRSVRTSLTSSAVGLTAGLGVLFLLDRDAGAWWHYVLGVVVGTVAFGGTRLLEERRRRDAVPGWRKIRETRREVEKLRRANEEISDLLDDLPTTRFYRLKDDISFLEKIERKRAEGRTEYSEIEVADSIGIRYVVSPFQLPVVVDRVERILDRRATEIEYKRGRYKAVHIEVDLLGVGAQKDLNLMAEVQVKTYLQHWYASRAHDVLYKDVPGRGHPLLRLAARWGPTRWAADRLLALPAAVEMLVFRRWMRWPRGEEETVREPKWRLREAEPEPES